MSHRYHIGLTLVSHRYHINITSVSHQPDAQIIAYYLRGAPQAIFLYYLREPPGCSTYRILPPRRAAGDFFILPPRASREPNYFTIKSCRGRSEIFHWKNRAKIAIVFLMHTDGFMVFTSQIRRDVRRPTAGGAGGEKSLAAPSYCGILAHSFARTHDTCTKTKPKSISRLGSLKDSPPQPPI